jgi:outer membrane protein assembly factor BamB
LSALAGVLAPALPRWRRSASEPVGLIAIFEEDGDQRVLIADADGGLECVDGADGQQVWRAELSSPASVLAARDIDGDRFAEILVGTTASEVIVLDGSTGREGWRRPLKNLYDAPAPATTLCVADLEGDGELSVLVGTAGWFVNVFQPDGTPKWENWFRYHVITALAAADVDGDGRAEVIVGNTYSTPLTVHEYDGSLRWSTLEQVGADGNATTPRRGIGLTKLKLADLDGNGRQEIVYGTEDGWIYAVDATDGAGIWRLNIIGKVVALERMPASIMVANEFGDLYTLRHDGHVSSRAHVSEWIHAVVRCGDDLFIANELGQLLRYDVTGTRTGAVQTDGKVEQLHCTGHDLIYALADGSICSYRME